MKTNRIFRLAVVMALAIAATGCYPEYFPRTGEGVWRGSAPLTVIVTDVNNERRAETRNATIKLDLLQDANSQNLFTRYPRVTFDANDSLRAVAPSEARPLSLVLLQNVRGDSTFDVRGRNANRNTFAFTIPSRTFSGQDAPIATVALPTASFSGRYVADNVVEGTISQTVSVPGQPTRIYAVTLRLQK
ncbi:MAG: hypothetical protein NZM06_08245 [Chloroherpetonaceae bacterium]|nr:hypothetical protein [Chloroherpetonaceae bacterium]MDW8438240.1 hypothetical protein [Chloroherpetonaceae bacterium]